MKTVILVDMGSRNRIYIVQSQGGEHTPIPLQRAIQLRLGWNEPSKLVIEIIRELASTIFGTSLALETRRPANYDLLIKVSTANESIRYVGRRGKRWSFNTFCRAETKEILPVKVLTKQ